MHLLTLKYCFCPLNAFVCLMKTSKHLFYCFSAHYSYNWTLFTVFYYLSKIFFFCYLSAHFSKNQNRTLKSFFPCQLLAHLFSKKENNKLLFTTLSFSQNGQFYLLKNSLSSYFWVPKLTGLVRSKLALLPSFS